MHLRKLVIAKTPNLMYRLNLQVTAYGRQTVPDRGVVRSYDSLKILEAKVVKFCTLAGYINSSNRMTYHQQKWRDYGLFLANVNVLRYVCYMLSAVRLSVCLSVCCL